ncbi:MAG: S-methyl-5-thioribose-1-phosphate isomerase, partial [Acidaminococcales bacterium]|nr:S-methyl-5-thioribose-1-phosphate isomerase [Acidaminococcales bacterium]
ANKKIGEYGAAVLPGKCAVFTHCNAGALATCGWGTALGVVRAAFGQGKITMVYAGETRPLLQGARITAWELAADGIPVTLVTDSMAGWVMKKGMAQLVITGADRIAPNGDTANKIGTFSLAVLARRHNIPFYIAAPVSTIDFSIKTGEEIPIEERADEEVKSFGGALVAPHNVKVFNPAFDVTPNELISAIITEKGVLYPPYEGKISSLTK